MKTTKLRNMTTEEIQKKMRELDIPAQRTKRKHERLGKPQNESLYYGHLREELISRGTLRRPVRIESPAQPPRARRCYAENRRSPAEFAIALERAAVAAKVKKTTA